MLVAQANALQFELGEEVSRRIMDPDASQEVVDLGSSAEKVDLTDVLAGGLGAVLFSDGRAEARQLTERDHPELYVIRREVEWLQTRARD